MKNNKILIYVILILLIVLGIAYKNVFIFQKHNTSMEITSSRFAHNGEMPKKYTCDGEDANPYLRITDIPNQAKTLVLIMDDPDAKKAVGKIWTHWIAFNIPVYGNESEILEDEKPKGKQGINDFGNIGYGGPCPPSGSGIHHYYFKIYALDSELLLEEGATKKEVEKAIENHIVDKAELIGTYKRE